MSTWHDLVTASLIGTERSVVPAPAIPGLPPAAELASAAATAGEDGDPAAVLLDRAALLTAARRAGRRPDRAEPLPVCEPDPRPVVSPAAADRLARMLGGEYPYLLFEWLRAVTAHGLRLPPQFLPTLLDRAGRLGPRDSELAHLVAEAGGPRVRWLAGLNPAWALMAVPAVTDDDAWRLGAYYQRRDYLAALVARDPDAARELVKSSWDAAGQAERITFLDVLADGLGLAVEPLLEAVLDDRGEGTQAWAVSRLARLPGSALGQRMAERALRWVRTEGSAHGMRLTVTPPTECDASMRRDGITPFQVAADRTRILLQVVGLTPLRTWSEEFGLTAAQIVALPSGDWGPILFTGWAQAATAQGDHEWMAALISKALTSHTPRSPTEIKALDRLVRWADPALGSPDTLPEPEPDIPPTVSAVLRVLRFRYEMMKELSDDGHDG